MNVKKYLVTGAAGFIGSNLAMQLCESGHTVVGIDSFHGYYSKALKLKNLSRLMDIKTFRFQELDILSLDQLDILKEALYNQNGR